MDMRRILLVAGLALLAAGIVWPLLAQLGLGGLPGDISVERPGVRLFFPIVTCVVISVVLSLLFWFFRK